jgi:hypothetical protein
MAPDKAPTIFHVTHWKAGSQWVRSILREAAPDRVALPRPDFSTPIFDGRIYTPVYAAYQQFEPSLSTAKPHRIFAVIRDPRDTVVSWYFSHLYSHRSEDPSVSESRQTLRKLDKTEGLALMIREKLVHAISIQRSWLRSPARVFRYENLREDQQEGFRQIFDYCQLEVPERRRRKIVLRNSFERRTWWRIGRENVRSHLRKGAVGDWRNHFCDRLKMLFKELYSDVLVEGGYEKDDAW